MDLKRKRCFVICMAIVMALGNVSAFAETRDSGYSDLSRKHWAYEEIMVLSDKGILEGYPDGSFRPARTVTYGEFVKMVYAACTEKCASNAGSGSHWAANYYFAALAEGFFKDDIVCEGMLGQDIPRKHMAHVAASVIKSAAAEDKTTAAENERAAGSSGYDYELFTDISEISEHSYDIMTACETGILKGYEDGSFGPERTLTRAEAAAVISRLISYCNSDLPKTEKEMKKTVVRKTETASGIIPVAYEIKKARMADFGIEKVEIVREDTLLIYSKAKHDMVFLMLADGTFVSPVGFPGGNSTEKDGYYVFAANPKEVELTNKKIYFMFEDGSTVYELEDLVIDGI